MYHGITYADEAVLSEDLGKLTVRFWHPIMKKGIIEFIRPEDCREKRHIKEMPMKLFSEANFTGLCEFNGEGEKVNWISELCDIYDKNSNHVGEYLPNKGKKGKERIPVVLLPVFHTTVAAQITVDIDVNGSFLGAQRVARRGQNDDYSSDGDFGKQDSRY